MTALGDTGGSAATITQILTGLGDLLDAIHEARGAGLDSSLADTLSAHLGVPADSLAVTKEEIEGHRYVDLDIALADIAGRDPAATVIGVGGGDMRYHHSLGDLVASRRYGMGATPVGQVDYQNLAVGPDRERAVVSFGVRLFRYRDVPVAALQRRASPRYGRDRAGLEVLCSDDALVADLLDELRRRAVEHSTASFARELVRRAGPHGRGRRVGGPR